MNKGSSICRYTVVKKSVAADIIQPDTFVASILPSKRDCIVLQPISIHIYENYNIFFIWNIKRKHKIVFYVQ